MHIFPMTINGDDMLKFVFPTKQRDVQKAIELAKEDERICRLIVFGSAVTVNCGMTSDIDFAIEADVTEDEYLKIARKFYLGIPSEIDLIHYNHIRNELLKHEIDTKGIAVYTRHDGEKRMSNVK